MSTFIFILARPISNKIGERSTMMLGFAINAIDPELMEPMFSTLIGRVALVTCAVMEILGYLMIRKITTIEV